MYSFMYICLSFVNIGWAVPWASCDNDWNTPICRDKPLIKLDGINDVAEKITASLCEYLSRCLSLVYIGWAVLLPLVLIGQLLAGQCLQRHRTMTENTPSCREK